MPPDMAINMRRSKLKAEEAALLAGELNKPTWESRNEGIHERVSFEDAIWGFDLAGGAFYKTPLRVVGVKPGSRAEKAGIRLGDKLIRINDIDTSTLTIQEAHKIIIDSGIHLRIAVTAPEDEEDQYFCYEDPIEEEYDSEEERWIEEEKMRKRQVHAKVNSYWSLQWPWVSKRRVIYRESNCFMVPSKYEDKHKDKFSPLESIRTQDDIVLGSINSNKSRLRPSNKQTENEQENSINDHQISNGNINEDNKVVNGVDNSIRNNGINGLGEIQELEEAEDEEVEYHDDTVTSSEPIEELDAGDLRNEVAIEANHDKIINEVLDDEIAEVDADKVLDSILSDEELVTENSNAVDER